MAVEIDRGVLTGDIVRSQIESEEKNDFSNTTIQGNVCIRDVRIDDLNFSGSTIEGELDLRDITIKTNLNLRGLTVKGCVWLKKVTIHGSFDMSEAVIENREDHQERMLSLVDIMIKGSLDLSGIRGLRKIQVSFVMAERVHRAAPITHLVEV